MEYQIDDLESLKYNGPGIINEQIELKRPNIVKRSKDRNVFQQESLQMANFLNKNV